MKNVLMGFLEWLVMEKVWGFMWKYVIREEDKWEIINDSMGNWRQRIRSNWYIYRGVDGVYQMINNK